MGNDCSACVNPENEIKFSQNLTRNKIKFIFDKNDETLSPKNNNDFLKARQNKYFERYSTRHKTIKEMGLSFENKKKFEESLGDNTQKSSNFNVKRNRKRSITTLTKYSKILQEELGLSISNKLFINEVRDIPNKKYKILSKLGVGSYGTVYLAENILTKTNYAMKRIDKNSEDLLIDTEIIDEINILRKLDHPDIVKIIEFYNTAEAYYIINDYCENGELFNQINRRFSETQIAIIFKQIFSGLCYLHSNNIIHRDLKLENILISEIEKSPVTKEEYYSIKIIDFGTAKLFNKKSNSNVIVGSSYYIAPEVLKKNYNEKCDLWSAGVILYMMLVGHAPFDGRNDREIIEKIKIGKFKTNEERWKNGSNEIRDLICKLLEFDPNKRINAKEALSHPFFITSNSNIFYDSIPKEKSLEYIKNLLSYRINSRFQEMVLAYIIHNMPKPKDAKNAIKLFKLFNEQGDGKLTKDELKNALLNFVTEDYLNNIDDIFIILDGDRDGFIDYEEFLRACLPKNEILNDEILAYAFNFFDKDHSGYIKVDQIKIYFVNQNVSENVFSKIFEEIDTNGDGKIDYSEFKNMMMNY
jgi:calcium-dependent protein kinase